MEVYRPCLVSLWRSRRSYTCAMICLCVHLDSGCCLPSLQERLCNPERFWLQRLSAKSAGGGERRRGGCVAESSKQTREDPLNSAPRNRPPRRNATRPGIMRSSPRGGRQKCSCWPRGMDARSPRPIPRDTAILRGLLAATRAASLSALGWPRAFFVSGGRVAVNFFGPVSSSFSFFLRWLFFLAALITVSYFFCRQTR